MDTSTRRAGGLTRGMRAALTEAMAMRRDGAPRETGLDHLAAAGFNEALAAMIMDHCDMVNRVARAAGRQGTRMRAAAANAAPNTTPNATFESRRQRSQRLRR